MTPHLIGGLGTTELLIILAVLILLFGATKLPELARGSGRALRIFKAETKGLIDDDEAPVVAPTPVDHRHTAESRILDDSTIESSTAARSTVGRSTVADDPHRQ